MDIKEISKGQTVTLAIPYASPIRTLDGVLHESGQAYKVLGGFNGCFVRLSRCTDKAKLIIEPARVALTR